MRNMSSPDFCVVCLVRMRYRLASRRESKHLHHAPRGVTQEGMWLNLLQRISLIDGVDVVKEDWLQDVSVKLRTIPLAQQSRGTSYEVTWTRNGQEQPDLKNVFEWVRPTDTARGSWNVKVRFVTPEVRYDPYGYLTGSQSFSI